MIGNFGSTLLSIMLNSTFLNGETYDSKKILETLQIYKFRMAR